MARIAEAEIERLKDEVSLVRLVESAGVKLAKRGGDMVGSCAFVGTGYFEAKRIIAARRDSGDQGLIY